jgi:CBS domain-containing protein
MVENPGRPEEETLEGDEGEPEIGRHADVGRQILSTPLSAIKQGAAPIIVGPDATVARAVEIMRKKRVSAVMVVDKKAPRKLIGVFTERDFLENALTTRGFAKVPVRKVMHRGPETLRPRDPVAYALNKMAVGRFRHVPLVDDRGVPVGMVSVRDVIDFIVELCPEEILNLPSDPALAVPRAVDGG